jgi:periplasmic divalent cation tolerance protein
MTDKIVVLTTCDSEAAATKLARELVEARVAACVNIVPGIRSVYRWDVSGKDAQGKDAIEDAEEWLLVIKSRRDLFGELRAAVAQLHTYDIPELVALPVVEGSEPYLAWMDQQLAAPKQP